MKKRLLLATILLGVILCFVVSGVGYGEILLGKYLHEEMTAWEEVEMAMQVEFLEVTISYIMRNPTSFLEVWFQYDEAGAFSALFPKDIDTKDKLYVDVLDNRGVFSGKSGPTLLDEVKKQLGDLFLFLEPMTTDIDNDVVVTIGVIPPGAKIRTQLAYFYQGEYHLWKDQK